MKDDSLFERLCQRISLSLLYADRLRHPEPDTTDLIHQFETHYPISILEGYANGLATLLYLGQTISHAEETLDIARAYLEIPALQNLTLAETLANRWRSLPEWESFQQSREIYCAIDLPGKVEEVDRLLG